MDQERTKELSALDRLDQMVGQQGVKDTLHRIDRRLRMTPEGQREPGFYCFLGNPGTGKTAVARLMGEILHEAGALAKGHVVACTPENLFAHLTIKQVMTGETGETGEDLLTNALDGVLLIDEAHLFTRPDQARSFGRLISRLSAPEIRQRVCVILAGYPKEMFGLLQADSGLLRHVGSSDSVILFDDYSPEELLEMMDRTASGDARQIHLSPEFREHSLRNFREVREKKDPGFGNAQFARQYLDAALARHRARMVGVSEETVTLTEEDIPRRYRSKLPASISADAVSTEDPFRRVSRWAVRLRCVSETGKPMDGGTGCIVTPQGHVLTCAHVVKDAEAVTAVLRTPDGAVEEYDCEILEPMYEDCDMALLRMKGEGFSAAPLRPAGEPAAPLTENVLLCGFPSGAQMSDTDALTCDILESVTRLPKSFPALPGDPVYFGGPRKRITAGGPVFSRKDGRLIGVFSGLVRSKGSSSDDRLYYFYPIKHFWEHFVRKPEEDHSNTNSGQGEAPQSGGRTWITLS